MYTTKMFVKICHYGKQTYDDNIVTVETCGSFSVANGQVHYSQSPLASGGYPVGTVGTWTCNYGFYKFYSFSTTCGSSGTWSHQDQFRSPYCARCNKFLNNISLKKKSFSSHWKTGARISKILCCRWLSMASTRKWWNNLQWLKNTI